MGKIIGLIVMVGVIGTIMFFVTWNAILQPVFTVTMPGMRAQPADWGAACGIGVLVMIQTIVVGVMKGVGDAIAKG